MKEDILIKDFPQSKGEHKLLKKNTEFKIYKARETQSKCKPQEKKGNVSCSTF